MPTPLRRSARNQAQHGPLPLRDTVQPITEVLPKPGKQFDQGSSGVGVIDICPFRTVRRDALQRLVEELLPIAHRRVGRPWGFSLCIHTIETVPGYHPVVEAIFSTTGAEPRL